MRRHNLVCQVHTVQESALTSTRSDVIPALATIPRYRVVLLLASFHLTFVQFWSEEYLQKAEIPVDLSLVEELLRKTE